MTWRAPRAQATSFLSSSPVLLLFLLLLPFFSPSCLSFTPSRSHPLFRYPCPALPSNPLWGGKPKAETGAKHDGMLEPGEPWAGAADKRPLCPLRKRLSQDPPAPPHTGAASLEAQACLVCTCSPITPSLLTDQFKWKKNSNSKEEERKNNLLPFCFHFEQTLI